MSSDLVADAGRNQFALAGWLFLRLLAIVHLIAFLSLWVQLDGLIGSRGLLPAANHLGLGEASLPRILVPIGIFVVVYTSVQALPSLMPSVRGATTRRDGSVVAAFADGFLRARRVTALSDTGIPACG